MKKIEAFFPSEENITILNNIKYLINPEHKDIENWFNNYFINHRNRICFDIDIIKNYSSKESKLLEYGALPLLLTTALHKSGYNITSIDLDPERMQSSIDKLGLNVIKCNIEIEKLPFETNYFDLIIFNELFEHLRINPIFTLSEAYRVLKPNGKILLSTPNLRSLEGIYNFLFNNLCYSCSPNIYRQYKQLETFGHMGHVREYTEREVSEFLKQIGFQHEVTIYRGRYYTNIKQIIVRLFPKLRPFISIIMNK